MSDETKPGSISRVEAIKRFFGITDAKTLMTEFKDLNEKEREELAVSAAKALGLELVSLNGK